ncbi:lipopolysaccharide biosynthesis protein [Chryseobacterium foetidum]|uniref:lipopolysaccharide biosynthesis protein n=1 Tax=Chryseobacterium foetidum TaxID=2951057 RepID=UPI0021C594C5|nr:lipopolysaccharide biosynthesis protein [Chryseobacterium foetidum]
MKTKNKIASGFAWSSIENISLQGVRFANGIFLARILAPSDYGIIGMLTVFMVFSEIIINSGFTAALIQKKDRKEIDYSTVFFFNIAISISVYLLLFILSPKIAEFYNMQDLEKITKYVAIPLIFNALCNVQYTRFQIYLNLKTPALISIICAVIQGLVGLSLAYNGYGVWSLIYSNIFGAVIRCIFLWIFSNWKPIFMFSLSSFKGLFDFGSKLLGVSLMEAAYTNIYSIVIGKFYNASTLGLFTRAQGYAFLPTSIITSLISKVTYPSFCSIHDEKDLFENYKKMIGTVSFVTFPIMIFLAVLAKPLIIFFITEKWIASAVLLQILCFATMWSPIYEVNISLIKALGKSSLLLKLQIVNKFFAIIVLIITLPRGVNIMCWGAVFISFLDISFNLYFTAKILSTSMIQQLKNILPALIMSSCSGLLIYLTTYHVTNNFSQLVLGSIVGLISYLLIAALFKNETLQYFTSVIRKRFRGIHK